jgi:hypothetical protein
MTQLSLIRYLANALKNLDSNSYVTAASLTSDAMFEAQICESSFSIEPCVLQYRVKST